NTFGDVSVLVGKKIVKVAIPPDRDNPSRKNAYIRDMSVMADGEHVFLHVSDSRSFFGRVDGEEIELLSGPRLWFDSSRDHPTDQHPFTYQDHQGGLWLALDPGRRLTFHKDRPAEGITVRRFLSPTDFQDFRDIGVPELVDARGCVWLAPRFGSEITKFTIWGPSGETSTLDIQQRTKNSPLFAAGPGRVFVWTTNGLQAYVNDDPAKPTRYETGSLFSLESPSGLAYSQKEIDFRYSPLGYVAVCDGGDVGGKKHLYLYPMERVSDKGGSGRTKSDDVAASTPKLRTWTDRSGRFSIDAEFAGAAAGKVRLRKADGSTITLPIDRLGDDSQAWIKEHAGNKDRPATGAATPTGSKVRKWSDVGGRFSIEAELLGVSAGKVRLRKSDGSVVTVALEKLSQADREFISKINTVD
ncbi:MAG: SHD1 domain-containing protein, partial [Pirellulales bacterium]